MGPVSRSAGSPACRLGLEQATRELRVAQEAVARLSVACNTLRSSVEQRYKAEGWTSFELRGPKGDVVDARVQMLDMLQERDSVREFTLEAGDISQAEYEQLLNFEGGGDWGSDSDAQSDEEATAAA